MIGSISVTKTNNNSDTTVALAKTRIVIVTEPKTSQPSPHLLSISHNFKHTTAATTEPCNPSTLKPHSKTRLSPSRIEVREEVIDGGLTSELALTSAARSHSATYTCHAANAFGRDTRNIELVVQGPWGRVPPVAWFCPVR